MALTAAGIVTSSFLRKQRAIGENVGDSATVKEIQSDQRSPTTNVPGADVSIISFNDYGCAACRTTHPELQKAVSQDGRSRITYKDWPIFGPASEHAAQIALASNYQGIYSSFHNALMTSYGLADEQLRLVLKNIGGSWDQILVDLKNHENEIEKQLNTNRLQAFALGLKGTPAFLIGPMLLRGGATKGEFLKVIEEARTLLN